MEYAMPFFQLNVICNRQSPRYANLVNVDFNRNLNIDDVFQEGIAVGRSFAMYKNYHIDGNKEMIAIGTMNIVGSFTSCYLTTGKHHHQILASILLLYINF